MSHASLSITRNEHDNVEDEQEELGRVQIVEFIKTCPDFIVRPADLSQEFGFSINDASAELCGLLQVVGQGASFHFEDTKTVRDENGERRVVKTMVFQFPADFDRRVVNADRHDTLKASIKICVKALKVVTALGLLLSILIVSVALVVALVAALIAFSNRGRESRVLHTTVSRQLRSLINTIRQLLFCYAMFGATIENDSGQNNFFREAALDTLLVINCCFSSPGSIFFWWRAGRIRQRWRRRVASRGAIGVFRDRSHSNDEDISLISGGGNASNTNQSSQSQQQGLISSLVMFLFGPTSPTGTSNAAKWRLRSAVIISKTCGDGGNIQPISLQELAPYIDSPPSSLDDSFQVVAEGLSIVAHFNGVPSSKSIVENNYSTEDQGRSGPKALFEFPELVSESNLGVRYDDNRMWAESESKHGWHDFFFESKNASSNVSESNSTRSYRASSNRKNVMPQYLWEQPKAFSSLSRSQFLSCLLLVVLNCIGVIWFSRSLEPGGVLEQSLGKLGSFLKAGIVPVLWFYARLFIAIPTGRLIIVIIYRDRCKRRNLKRKFIASQLSK